MTLHCSEMTLQCAEWTALRVETTVRDADAAVTSDCAIATIRRAGAPLSNDQGTATLQIAGHLSRQKALVTTLRTQHMQPIAIFARARLRRAPDYAALSRSAPHLQFKQLVRAARAMATAAAPHVDEMVRGGFPPDTVTQLAAAADAVEQAQADRTNTRVRRVGATKGIAEAILAGREALAMLHAVIRSQFAGNPTFLAAWDSARRVTNKLGPARGTGAAAAVSSAPAAVASSAATP